MFGLCTEIAWANFFLHYMIVQDDSLNGPLPFEVLNCTPCQVCCLWNEMFYYANCCALKAPIFLFILLVSCNATASASTVLIYLTKGTLEDILCE